MNIHDARTPPFRTASKHTCCQGQTSGLTVRPDVARCICVTLVLEGRIWRIRPSKTKVMNFSSNMVNRK